MHYNSAKKKLLPLLGAPKQLYKGTSYRIWMPTFISGEQTSLEFFVTLHTLRLMMPCEVLIDD